MEGRLCTRKKGQLLEQVVLLLVTVSEVHFLLLEATHQPVASLLLADKCVIDAINERVAIITDRPLKQRLIA
ncbi:uncharacterized protein isoform X2 [Rhodnius prolixus]|uniref:uncharacterized protein isoform X2 n=1 Tax=Rhodnius prolixus TaxID=13249 RepID=UPI003D18F276